MESNKMKKEIKYIVTADDLIGNISGFPIEVVQKMVDYQIKQGNAPDVVTFQMNCFTSKFYGGFDWDETDEGADFWREVIGFDKFDLFFKNILKNILQMIQAQKVKKGLMAQMKLKIIEMV